MKFYFSFLRLKVKNYVMSTKLTTPCALFGVSGTGKSSIMAKLVKEVKENSYKNLRKEKKIFI